MKQKALSKWLKVILIGIGICGLVFYLYILPDWGQSLADHYPDHSGTVLYRTGARVEDCGQYRERPFIFCGKCEPFKVDLLARGRGYGVLFCGKYCATLYEHESSGHRTVGPGRRFRGDLRDGGSGSIVAPRPKSRRSAGRKRSDDLRRERWKAKSFSILTSCWRNGR